jgi:Methyltransferase domain
MSVVMTEPADQLIRRCVSNSQSRIDFWAEFIRSTQVESMVEVGVYEGDFAVDILSRCENVSKYYMIDPWKHLADWNKPANQDDGRFERMFQSVKSKTDFAQSRRVILRGKTVDVIDQVSDGELDFAYIDGDHTLRGITIDLIRVYPKVRIGGFIGGDDFSRTIWSHKTTFEPTMVFPLAVYFAEAVGATLYALPNIQFLMQKTDKAQFAFVDLTGQYDDLGIRSHVEPKKMLNLYLGERFPGLLRAFRSVRGLVS